jgi:two-component system, cell cycle response regulator
VSLQNALMDKVNSVRTRLHLGQAQTCSDELRLWLEQCKPEDPERLELLVLRCEALADIPAAAEELLTVAQDLAHEAVRRCLKGSLAAAHCHRSTAYRRLGLRSEASQQAVEALRLAHEAGDQALQSRALLCSAWQPIDTGDFAEARRLIGESLACAEADGQPTTIFWPLNNIAHLLGVEAAALAADGENDTARAKVVELVNVVERSLTLARAAGHPLQEAFALSNLADAYIVEGNPARARELIAAYADIARHIGSTRLQAYAEMDEVRLLRASGRTEEAIAVLMSPALADYLQGNKDIDRTRLQALYELHKSLGRFELALAYHEQLANMQAVMLSDQAARMQRVLLARLDLEQAQAAAERARLETHSERLRAQALERERDQHRRDSLHDPLTGLANRRAAEEQWDGHADRAAREGQWFFAAVIDIDHFKRVNDTYGHAKGDAVLTETARVMHGLLRRRDGLYRLGGEEFLALMAAPSPSAGLAACERLRIGVASLDWSSVATGLSITVSIGVACRHEAESQSSLLSRADAALYAAKRGGRDRCVEG